MVNVVSSLEVLAVVISVSTVSDITEFRGSVDELASVVDSVTIVDMVSIELTLLAKFIDVKEPLFWRELSEVGRLIDDTAVIDNIVIEVLSVSMVTEEGDNIVLEENCASIDVNELSYEMKLCMLLVKLADMRNGSERVLSEWIVFIREADLSYASIPDIPS